MRMFWRRKPEAAPSAVDDKADVLLSPAGVTHRTAVARLAAFRKATLDAAPTIAASGADVDGDPFRKNVWTRGTGEAPAALTSWFAAQTFIGWQFAAMISQHWFVDKACTMPAKDAVRRGFAMSVDGVEDQTDAIKLLDRANRRFGLNGQMQEFVRKGRVFGVRVMLFRVESTDPKYYELPFNPDAVTPGSYRGMTQIDPYWCAPMLDGPAATNPASAEFYEPTWWIINGKKYHRTHLRIFRTCDLPDILKPMYVYGGVPLPQRLMERVYAAERTANESPLLTMTKRLLVWKTELTKFLANPEGAQQHMAALTEWRDNMGAHIVDKSDEVAQIETSLSNLDDVITNQYVIACAIAEVPVTRMMGTSAKGLNATGEGDEANYHETLESIQANDLDPVLDRHLLLVTRSIVEPALSLAPGSLDVTATWHPLDTPTAKERAETEKLEAERDAALVAAGALDGTDVRRRLRADKTGDYTDIEEEVDLEPLAAEDAAPRPLYVSRKLVNVAEVRAWAKSQGLTLAADPHVTVTRSRAPVDWFAMGDNWSSDQNGNLTIEAGGARMVERLGDKGALALLFTSSALSFRHAQMRERGASWDHPDYQPHVTIQYDAPADLDVEPYRGKLVFGPEIFADFVDNWRPDGDA